MLRAWQTRRHGRDRAIEVGDSDALWSSGTVSVCGHSHTGEAGESTLLVADVAKSARPRRAEQ